MGLGLRCEDSPSGPLIGRASMKSTVEEGRWEISLRLELLKRRSEERRVGKECVP